MTEMGRTGIYGVREQGVVKIKGRHMGISDSGTLMISSSNMRITTQIYLYLYMAIERFKLTENKYASIIRNSVIFIMLLIKLFPEFLVGNMANKNWSV